MTGRISGALLGLVLVVMFHNYRDGTLGQWFRSKFLNDSPEDNATAARSGGGGNALTSAAAEAVAAGTKKLPTAPPAAPVVAAPNFGVPGQ